MNDTAHRHQLVVWAILAVNVVSLSLSAALVVTFEHDTLIINLAMAAITVAGGLILLRQFRNPIGWLFLISGTVLTAGALPDAYARYALANHADAELSLLVRWSAWFSAITIFPAFFLLIALGLMLFPTGTLLSPRWRWLARAIVTEVVLITLGAAFMPGTFPDHEEYPRLTNPLGIDRMRTVITVVDGFSAIVLPIILLGSLTSLVLRIRRSRGIERQQLKWFGYAAVLVMVFLVGMIVVSVARPDTLVHDVTFFVFFFGVTFCLPASVLMAVARYQLYGIDRIINRTLVYASLTVTLAGIYTAVVLTLQRLLDPLTQGDDLAIAASTLAVAALFQPARRRVQHIVNRRFYRRTYDVAHTIDAFSAQLRDEVDLDSIARELRIVVQETMQPTFFSLWLRPGPGSHEQ